jgi:hypothetical protein
MVISYVSVFAADAHENVTSRCVSEITVPGSHVLFFSGAVSVTAPGEFTVGVGGVGAGVGAGSPPEHPITIKNRI